MPNHKNPRKVARHTPPRDCNYYGKVTHPHKIGETWLEPEELCYPKGGMTRRALCLMPDATLRVITCGIPDTAFSIPARVRINDITIRGFVSSDETGYKFTPYTNQEGHNA